MRRVLVTGGAGYVGAVLVPKLLEAGYDVKVIDLYLYGRDVLKAHPRLTEVVGDIRDRRLLEREVPGTDAVIHLACISNDPSYELNPALGRSINFEAFGPLVEICRARGVRRFVFASSSSVYGVKRDPEVTEDLSLEPLTDYSKYKALCEEVLLGRRTDGFVPVIFRPATVCGYSPRLRLDLTVNILTHHAVQRGRITVFGGQQKRPNIHIDDITDLYVESLRYPDDRIDGRIFNAGYENHTVLELARLVRRAVGREDVELDVVPSDDKRSYAISSRRLREALGFVPRRTIAEAVRDLAAAFHRGDVPDASTDKRYYNIRTMQACGLT